MGLYLNPGNAAFEISRFSELYIDKSMLIAKINAIYKAEKRFICVSRPRRFGKSMAANMLSAYYSCGCDSRQLFAGLEIEKEKSFSLHLNRHNIIRLDIQRFLESERDLDTFIAQIESKVVRELVDGFPECKDFTCDSRLKDALDQIFVQTGQGFVFIIDEWDCVFRIAKERIKVQKNYLDFLRGLFKGGDYVELAYMTGILPIKKYGEHSAVNIFKECSMLNPGYVARYFGFTESEVKGLCVKYGVDYGMAERWYDGYLLGGQHLYNPHAVTELMDNGEFQSYWTGTETYEALKIYIDQNFDGLKEAIMEMLGNGRCKINARKFQNDMTTFKTRDDVLTLLVHLGYLTFDKKTSEVFIPNLEVAQEFLNAVDDPGWGEVVRSISRSENILKSTWEMDGEAVADGVAAIHSETASILKYNDENSLKCTVLMAYYSARAYYLPPELELPSGKGYADIVYLPRRNVGRPALLIELKWNKSAQGAISQIKSKQYAKWIKEYTGDIFLVGINYDEEKGHECIIEKYERNEEIVGGKYDRDGDIK